MSERNKSEARKMAAARIAEARKKASSVNRTKAAAEARRVEAAYISSMSLPPARRTSPKASARRTSPKSARRTSPKSARRTSPKSARRTSPKSARRTSPRIPALGRDILERIAYFTQDPRALAIALNDPYVTAPAMREYEERERLNDERLLLERIKARERQREERARKKEEEDWAAGLARYELERPERERLKRIEQERRKLENFQRAFPNSGMSEIRDPEPNFGPRAPYKSSYNPSDEGQDWLSYNH